MKLDESNILSFSKELTELMIVCRRVENIVGKEKKSGYPPSLNSSPNDKILALTKFKAFAEDKITVTQKLKFMLGRVEDIVEQERQIVTRYAPSYPKL